MSGERLTPGKAAKEWAKAHPDFVGMLRVLSWTRKGRGGWGKTTRGNSFFVREGKAAMRRDKRSEGTFNGVCRVCGEVYLKPVLRWAHGPDPLAGEPVPKEELWSQYQGAEFFYYGQAQIRACPSCVEIHGFEIGWIGGVGPKWEGRGDLWVREHPMCKFWDRDLPVEELDLRGDG